MTKGYNAHTDAAAYAYYMNSEHMVKHVVSFADPEFADGIHLGDIDKFIYWRQSDDPNNLLYNFANQMLVQYHLEDRFRPENVFFVSNIQSLLGTSFEHAVEFTTLNRTIKVIDAHRMTLVSLARKYTPKNIAYTDIDGVIDDIHEKAKKPSVVVFPIQIRHGIVMLITVGPDVQALTTHLLHSGAQLSLAAIQSKFDMPSPDLLFPLQDVTVLKSLNTSWIRAPVKAYVDFALKDLLRDKHLPRTHMCFGDIAKSFEEKNNFAIDKIMCAYMTFLSIYRPHSQSQLEDALSTHIRQGLRWTPNDISMGNSGIASMNAILTAIKGKVLVMPNVYFEVLGANQHRALKDVSHPSNKFSIDTIETDIVFGGVFVDEAWSMIMHKHDYFPIDNIALVQKLLYNKQLSKGAIVALDVTIDTVNSPRVLKFVNAMRPHVRNGAITLVVFSSMQKLYQFGLDRLSGGWSAWFGSSHNKPTSVTLPVIATTGYTNVLRFGISDYANAVHRNNRYFYKKIATACGKVTTVDKNAILINVDVESIDDHNHDAFDTIVSIIKCVPDLYIGSRVSWGFRHSVLMPVENKIRTSIGACVTKAEMNKLVKCYCQHMLVSPGFTAHQEETSTSGIQRYKKLK
jgi:hypothetical protein